MIKPETMKQLLEIIRKHNLTIDIHKDTNSTIVTILHPQNKQKFIDVTFSNKTENMSVITEEFQVDGTRVIEIITEQIIKDLK